MLADQGSSGLPLRDCLSSKDTARNGRSKTYLRCCPPFLNVKVGACHESGDLNHSQLEIDTRSLFWHNQAEAGVAVLPACTWRGLPTGNWCELCFAGTAAQSMAGDMQCALLVKRQQ